MVEDNYLHAYDVSVQMEAYLQINTHILKQATNSDAARRNLSTRPTIDGVERGRLSWLNQSRACSWADMQTGLSWSLVLLDLRENTSVSVSG